MVPLTVTFLLALQYGTRKNIYFHGDPFLSKIRSDPSGQVCDPDSNPSSTQSLALVLIPALTLAVNLPPIQSKPTPHRHSISNHNPYPYDVPQNQL